MADGLERMPFEELQQHEDMVRLGHMLGMTLMDRIKDQVVKMDDQQRVVFFCALLRVQTVAMKASLGAEATLAILDTAKEYITNG